MSAGTTIKGSDAGLLQTGQNPLNQGGLTIIKKEEPKKSAGPIPLPPTVSPEEFKKLTADIKSLSVNLDGLLDAQGDLLPEKVGEAKNRIKTKASQLEKDQLPSLASRLYKKIVQLEPKNIGVRLDLARTLHAAADQAGKADLRDLYRQEAFKEIKTLVDIVKGNRVPVFMNYKAALSAVQKAADFHPEISKELPLFKETLIRQAARFQVKGQEALDAKNSPIALFLLSEAAKIYAALGNQESLKVVSEKLAKLSKDMGLSKISDEVQKFAAQGFLSPETLKTSSLKLENLVTSQSKGLHKFRLEFKEAYQKMKSAEKLAVLQELSRLGLLGQIRHQASQEKDPNKKLYYQAKQDLLEGNLPSAQLKMVEFKTKTKGVKDTEILEMRTEIRGILRQESLKALSRLKERNEALKTQRHSRVEGKFFDPRPMAQLKDRILNHVQTSLKSGHVDTLEEGIALLYAEDKKLKEAFQKNPVIQKNWLVSFFPGVSSVKLAGGALEINETPSTLSVTVGKEGGIVRIKKTSEGLKKISVYYETFYFPPSDQEKIVSLDYGRFSAPHLKADKDYQEFARGKEPEGLKNLKREDSLTQHPQTLSELADHWTNLNIQDPDFLTLFNLETRAGWEKMKTPDSRRQHLLEVAQEVRHRNGSYVVVGEILEDLFSKDYAEALAEITPHQKKKITQEVETDRPKIEKEVRKSLEKMKKEKPAEWTLRYPKGEPSKDEIKQMVDEAATSKIAFKMKRLAFEKLDSWHNNWTLSDPIADKAWKIYEDMKDPLDKFWNLADDSWDGIVDEVVTTVVTMPIAMGVGSAVRGALGGTSLMLRLSAQGGLRAFAAKSAIFTVGAFVEGHTMEAVNAGLFTGEFHLKNAGWNAVMSTAFHRGGHLWGKISGTFGLAEKKLVNFAGMMATQTSVATAMGYAHEILGEEGPPRTFWERLGGEALRMLAFHYGTMAMNQATGGVLQQREMLSQARQGVAKEIYETLRPRLQAELVQNGVAEKMAERMAKDLSLELSVTEAKQFQLPVPEAPTAAKESTPALESKPKSSTEVVSPEQIILSREQFLGQQVKRTREIAAQFGEGPNEIFIKALDRLVVEDIRWAERNPEASGSSKTMETRLQRYLDRAPEALRTNPQFKEAVARLVEENLRGGAPLEEKMAARSAADPIVRPQVANISALIPQKGEFLYKGKTLAAGDAVLEGEGTPVVVSFGEKGKRIFTTVNGVEPNLLFGKNEQASLGNGAYYLYVPPGTPVKIFRTKLGKLQEVSQERGVKDPELKNAPLRFEILNGNVLEVAGRRYTFKTPEGIQTEIASRRAVVTDRKSIEALQGEIQSLKEKIEALQKQEKPDSGEIAALEKKQKDLVHALGQKEKAYDSKVAKELPKVIQEIADPLFNGRLEEGGRTIEIFDSQGRVRPEARIALRNQMVKALAEAKIKISTDNSKAVDSIIDLALSAKTHGIIDQPGGLTRETFFKLVGELYFHNNPNVRIGLTELTHVPMVVEETLNHYEMLLGSRGETATPSQKKAVFLAALLHDSGKWDPNIRTQTGFTILASSPFNKTGKDVVVKPGQSLNEALQEQKINPNDVKLPFGGMTAILVHHDAATVRTRLKQLVDQGSLSPLEGQQVWEAIQYHGFVSSWIVNNSLGGLGIKSHVFNEKFDPVLKEYLEAYQAVSKKLDEKGTSSDLNALMKEPFFAADVESLRGIFKKFPPLVQALMLGDHQGQIDIAKYMTILSNVPANKEASLHDLFFGHSLENSVLGVLRKHGLEQQILSPREGEATSAAFQAAEAWLKAPGDQVGLSQAILKNPTLKSKFETWRDDPANTSSDKSVHEWLKTLKVKSDGKATEECQKIQALVESAFYEFYALNAEAPLGWGPKAPQPKTVVNRRPFLPGQDTKTMGSPALAAQSSASPELSRSEALAPKDKTVRRKGLASSETPSPRSEDITAAPSHRAKTAFEDAHRFAEEIKQIQEELQKLPTDQKKERARLEGQLKNINDKLMARLKIVPEWKDYANERDALVNMIRNFLRPYEIKMIKGRGAELAEQARGAKSEEEDRIAPLKGTGEAAVEAQILTIDSPRFHINPKRGSYTDPVELARDVQVGGLKPENYRVEITVRNAKDRENLIKQIETENPGTKVIWEEGGRTSLEVTREGKTFTVEVKTAPTTQESTVKVSYESVTSPGTPLVFKVGEAKSPALIVRSPHKIPTWKVEHISEDGKTIRLKNVKDPSQHIFVESPVDNPFKWGEGVEIAGIGGGGSVGKSLSSPQGLSVLSANADGQFSPSQKIGNPFETLQGPASLGRRVVVSQRFGTGEIFIGEEKGEIPLFELIRGRNTFALKPLEGVKEFGGLELGGKNIGVGQQAILSPGEISLGVGDHRMYLTVPSVEGEGPSKKIQEAPIAARPPSSEVLKPIPSPSSSGINPQIVQRVQESLVQEVIRKARGAGIHRNSPFVATKNEISVDLLFDTDTGRLVDPQNANGKGNLFGIKIVADLEAGGIVLQRDTVEGLGHLLKEGRLNQGQRSVVVAILGLGQGAGTEGPRLLSFAPSGNAPVQKTPQVSPEKLVELQKALREGLHKESQGQGMPLNMTIRLDPFYIALGEGLSVYQGHLFFDGSGHIVGTEFALADFASPRGTTYQNGIRSPFQARVVISSEGALLGVLDRNGHPIDLDAASHVLPPGLNKAQVASIMALWKSPQHQADRNRVLENNPFIVGMVSYKGTGQLIHELKSLLEAAPRRGNGPKKLQLALLQGEDGYKWVPAGGKPTQGLAVVTVEYKSPESVTDAGSFQYSVTQGTFPPEVSKALQFLAGKISRPYMKI